MLGDMTYIQDVLGTSTSVLLNYVKGHVLHSGYINSSSVLLNYNRHGLHSGCITSTSVL
jgi:hypothetical protein